MFRKLCGKKSLKNVVIVTTMWDKVSPEEGLQRERELKSGKNLFKPLLDGGAIMIRHDRTPKTANRVINHLLKKYPTVTQIAHELVEEKKALVETDAGTELSNDIQTSMKQREMESFRADLERATHAEFHKLARLMTEVDELKRGITRSIAWCVSWRMCMQLS